MFYLCLFLNNSKCMPIQKKTKITGNFSTMDFKDVRGSSLLSGLYVRKCTKTKISVPPEGPSYPHPRTLFLLQSILK